jgi:hypothetical protein
VAELGAGVFAESSRAVDDVAAVAGDVIVAAPFDVST